MNATRTHWSEPRPGDIDLMRSTDRALLEQAWQACQPWVVATRHHWDTWLRTRTRTGALTVGEVAAGLHRPRYRVYDSLRYGGLHAVKGRQGWRIPRRSVESHLHRLERGVEQVRVRLERLRVRQALREGSR